MPNEIEAIRIAAHHAWTNTDHLFEDRESASNQDMLTTKEILNESRYPVVRTTTGRVKPYPNHFWALERQIDARCRELFDNKNLSEVERATLMGEMRGIAVAYSMSSGMTIEELSREAMARYQKWKAGQ